MIADGRWQRAARPTEASSRRAHLQPSRLQAPSRRSTVTVRADANGNGNGKPEKSTQDAISSLDARIQSGEFTEGSTKEQLTRPIRKFLAQDPLGVGASPAEKTASQYRGA